MAKWIKVETHTPDKAELRQVARLCHCSKADAFLAFFRVFVWLDEQTEDGHVDFFTAADADDIAGLKGFGEALEAVGWVTFGRAVESTALFGMRCTDFLTGSSQGPAT